MKTLITIRGEIKQLQELLDKIEIESYKVAT